MNDDMRHKYLLEKLDNWVSTAPPAWAQAFIDSLFYTHTLYTGESTTLEDWAWEQDEPLDPHVWNCGERDCPTGWHLGYYYFNFGVKGGKRFVETLWDSHGDGDAQPDLYWEDGVPPDEIVNFLSSTDDNYFKNWARYWLECYETDTDVLDISTAPHNRARFLDFAEDDINYLYMDRKASNK